MPHEVQAVRKRRKIARGPFRRLKWQILAGAAGIATAIAFMMMVIAARQPSIQSTPGNAVSERTTAGSGSAAELAVQREDASAATSAALTEQKEAAAQQLAEEQAIAAAREKEAQEAQEAQEKAATQAREAAAEKARAAALEAEQRAALQMRRVQLANALARASQQRDQRKLDEAEASLDEATTLDRNDASLKALRSRWRAALIDARTPVSDNDFDQVIERFDKLRRALESNDVATMESLTLSSNQNALFRQLMSRFTRLDISINQIRVRNADKSISATLRIESMVRDNGDRATPSPAYRERLISSQRTEGQWSLIQW